MNSVEHRLAKITEKVEPVKYTLNIRLADSEKSDLDFVTDYLACSKNDAMSRAIAFFRIYLDPASRSGIT